MTPDPLATTNAVLNGAALALLLRGRILARRGDLDAHRRTMLSAFGLSAVFLVLYVARKVVFGFESHTFHAEGAAQAAYLFILATHVPLAALVPVLAIALIRFGLRGERARHRRLARWVWPVWLYVSVTGVVIYVLLYVVNPAPA